MTIASEITRLQGVKSNILSAIADKGVTVPVGSALADCPELIALISGGGGDGVEIAPIAAAHSIYVVDEDGYIGLDITPYYQYYGASVPYDYNYAVKVSGADFSSLGLGQVTFVNIASNWIGGRQYQTVVIGGKEWMAENLDFKFSGLLVGKSGTSSGENRANYYNNNESTYGVNGNKYGLLYNWIAVKYLNDHKSELIPGWHVPTSTEWDALATAVGGTSVAGTMLKSTTGWNSGNGNGSTAFSAFPAGYYNGSFNAVGSYAYFWSATENSSSYAYGRYFYAGASMDSNRDDKYYQFSVRLVKDSQ